MRNHSFRASDVAEHLYEISIIFDAYRANYGKRLYCAMTTTNFLAALGPSGTTHQASNVAAPHPGFTGAQLDSNHLQEEMYMHASRA